MCHTFHEIKICSSTQTKNKKESSNTFPKITHKTYNKCKYYGWKNYLFLQAYRPHNKTTYQKVYRITSSHKCFALTMYYRKWNYLRFKSCVLLQVSYSNLSWSAREIRVWVLMCLNDLKILTGKINFDYLYYFSFFLL